MVLVIQKEFYYGPRVSWTVIHGRSRHSVGVRVQFHLEAAFTSALVDSQFRLWARCNQLELTETPPNTTKESELNF